MAEEVKRAMKKHKEEKRAREMMIVANNPFGGYVAPASPAISAFQTNPQPAQAFSWNNPAAAKALEEAERKKEGPRRRQEEAPNTPAAVPPAVPARPTPNPSPTPKVETKQEEKQRKAMEEWEAKTRAMMEAGKAQSQEATEETPEEREEKLRLWTERLEALLHEETIHRMLMWKQLDEGAKEIASHEKWWRKCQEKQKEDRALKEARWERRRREEEEKRLEEDEAYRKAKEEEQYRESLRK